MNASFRLTAAAMAAFSMLTTMAQADTPRSRADVIAEVQAARAAGTLEALTGEDSGSFHLAHVANLSRQASAGRTRADVVAEVAEWRSSGAMEAFRAEFEGLVGLGSTLPPSTLTRAEVHGEVLAARASGELDAYAGEDSGSFHLARAGYGAAATAFAGVRRPSTLLAARSVAQMGQMCASPAVADGQARLAGLQLR
ncbi:MAG: DUF4148 domain-containing protein [Betaproteobacteria bacterium]|nr:DUF4148 domain-containing protein [Betaproteobacteria bacterium]MCC6247742.1 DUF4148 domain-containing protein [Rubrivivax sp.]